MQTRPAGHIGTGVGFLVVILATVGIVMIPRSPAPEVAPTPLPKRPAPAPTPLGFDPALAAQGKELHARVLAAANVRELYLGGSLWGAGTPEPKASIAVPLEAWKTLAEEDRVALMHYAASLVERIKADSLRYSQVPASAPASLTVRENVVHVGPRSWVVIGGRLQRDGDAGPFDILTDEVVASGADHALGAGPR